jgi:acyl-homoserine-lactone acylase
VVFDNASLSAELLVDAVIERCAGAGTVTVEGHESDLGVAVEVLANWDRRFDLDSRGAALWREFMGGFPETAWMDAGHLFAVAFDPEDAMGTPSGLAAEPSTGDDPVVHALGHAMRVLAAAGIAPDAALGDVQWADRGGRRVPIHGGGESDGLLNVIVPTGALPPASLEPVPEAAISIPGRVSTGLAEGGYRVTYGTSFLMAVELTAAGPQGRGLMAYGQSGDPRSPHHSDGTEAFAAKATRPLLFDDDDIAADPELRTFTLES